MCFSGCVQVNSVWVSVWTDKYAGNSKPVIWEDLSATGFFSTQNVHKRQTNRVTYWQRAELHYRTYLSRHMAVHISTFLMSTLAVLPTCHLSFATSALLVTAATFTRTLEEDKRVTILVFVWQVILLFWSLKRLVLTLRDLFTEHWGQSGLMGWLV